MLLQFEISFQIKIFNHRCYLKFDNTLNSSKCIIKFDTLFDAVLSHDIMNGSFRQRSRHETSQS